MGRVLGGAAAALLVTGGVLIAAPAQAAPDENGLLRLAHLSPDTPAVDVYVDAVADPASGITLEGVGYGTVSDYQDVPAGAYTVSMRAAGASPDTPPVLSTTVEVTGDSARTVAGVGLFEDLGLQIIDDSLETPPAGQARVRLVAAAASAETLDVSFADGTAVATDLAFAGTSEYVDVPAGETTVQVSAGGGPAADLPVDLDEGAVYSLLVLDADDAGLRVQPVLDSAGVAATPVGGVETGAGGTAADDGSSAAPGVAALLLGLGGAAALARVRSPRRHAAHATGPR